MTMKKKKKNGISDYIKANRKGSREAEIENHDRPISYNRVHISKKIYNRKKNKADSNENLPYFFRYMIIDYSSSIGPYSIPSFSQCLVRLVFKEFTNLL